MWKQQLHLVSEWLLKKRDLLNRLHLFGVYFSHSYTALRNSDDASLALPSSMQNCFKLTISIEHLLRFISLIVRWRYSNCPVLCDCWILFVVNYTIPPDITAIWRYKLRRFERLRVRRREMASLLHHSRTRLKRTPSSFYTDLLQLQPHRVLFPSPRTQFHCTIINISFL